MSDLEVRKKINAILSEEAYMGGKTDVANRCRDLVNMVQDVFGRDEPNAQMVAAELKKLHRILVSMC